MAGIDVIPRADWENLTAIADFAELECLRRDDGNVSVLDVVRMIERESERKSQEVIAEIVQSAMDDLKDREKHVGTSGARYPFRLDESGNLVQFCGESGETDWAVYLFLLLATRLNMQSERTHADEDGTALFEELCCEVGKQLWGGHDDPRVQGMVFGTARTSVNVRDDDLIDIGSFSTAVDQLCIRLKEGLHYDPKSKKPTARDGKLDVVIWRRFSDEREGQLIGFGQCKTGTNWQNDMTKLRPGDFFSKWARRLPTVLPQRLYFIADRETKRWYEHTTDAGVLLDRCRIMDYCSNIPVRLLERIHNWVSEAAKSKGLRLP